jgi:hypothetical protein
MFETGRPTKLRLPAYMVVLGGRVCKFQVKTQPPTRVGADEGDVPGRRFPSWRHGGSYLSFHRGLVVFG